MTRFSCLKDATLLICVGMITPAATALGLMVVLDRMNRRDKGRG